MNWHAFLQNWVHQASNRGFQSETLVEVGGYPLLASTKGDPSKPSVYLSSGMHGDEPSGPRALLGLLKDDFFDDRFHWLICPVLNPTGLEAGTRENHEGVDLNRDYCLCTTKEVCSHIEWLKNMPVPELFLSLHEDWESSGFYFYEINTGGGDSPNQEVMEAAAPHFPPEPEEIIDDHPVTGPGWIYHSEHPDLPQGWPEAIYLAKLGCPLSLTFETPSQAEPDRRVACHQAVVRKAIDTCLL